MTKAQEIQILTETANTLGIDSYCGEWLRDQIPHIEHDMRCDILPTSSWSETRRLHDGMLNTAREQANYIIKDANEKAGKLMGDAQKHSENTRRTLARDIQRALDAL
jgi:cell division septum initiation protein DivIVA